MEISLPDKDAKLYGRLHVSILDLDLARYCVGVILKKKWHHQPWEKRGTIYLQQSTFMSALVIAYARPFTESRGWPNFPPDLKAFMTEENELHDKMMKLRNTVYGHSDSASYSVTPWRTPKFSTDIVGAPVFRISAQEATLLKRMIDKLNFAVRRRMAEIVPTND
jgi:hypothetical protein